VNEGNANPAHFHIHGPKGNETAMGDTHAHRLKDPIRHTLTTNKLSADVFDPRVLPDIILEELALVDVVRVVNL
jgi:hypothetical protein